MLNSHLAAVVATALLLIAGPPLAHAAGQGDGGRKPYPCNPQKECMARAADLKGAAAAAAKRDCSRMPTSGTCYGASVDTPADRSDRGKDKKK
jgi:hypothetical protein